MSKAVMAKKLFENLQSDLKQLSAEAKKKHPPVKEVGDVISIFKCGSYLYEALLIAVKFSTDR